MALLEAPDVVVRDEVAETNAVDAMEALCLRTLSGQAPKAGDTLRASPHAPMFEVERGPDPTPPTHPTHNPFGLWRLTATGRR